MKPKPTHADLAGSRYLALQRLARAQKRTTAELLQLYVLESFLRRLVRSRHDHTLVLKGGMLLAAFDLRRATRDVDVLALNTDNDPAAVQRLLDGMPNEAQARWATWRERQGAQDRVPEDFATVLGALDERTQAWLLKATE